MTSTHRSRGLTRVDVLVFVAVGAFLLLLVPVIGRYMRSDSSRATCKANLSAIGKAMLVYANDNDGNLPRAGGRSTIWNPYIGYRWRGGDPRRVFGVGADGSGGEATVSSSLYLLVKYMGLQPRQFVCPGDVGTTEFNPVIVESNGQRVLNLSDIWDFGGESYRHCSYAYHMLYSPYGLTTGSDPGMAVAADRNPWINSPAGKVKDFVSFEPDIKPWNGMPQEARRGNSLSHGQAGQNVLFLDGHVSFEERAYCGPKGDNIYTISRDATRGDALGIQPVVSSSGSPASAMDSLLVHDPAPLYQDVATNQAPSVNSKDLRQTAVVATLDCPLPEYGNAIWCATFQMAWDKYKQDIAGGSIQINGPEDLVNRLSRGQFPTGAIEETSYYATAGYVNRGIIEQIRKEMSRRFPAEPAPVFDERYRTLERVAVAYAYLSVDVGFVHPYYSLDYAFGFTDSSGVRTGVTAFCAQNELLAADHVQIREQVEVLYDNQADSPEALEFAVDLCRDTKPYQVVLARVPRTATLGEAARSLNEKIARFRNDPNYTALSKLRRVDTLIVPDVLYKLTHHFDELLGKQIGNMPGATIIIEAMQRIDFTLSRTGVILRSEARMGTSTTKSRDIDEPRHLHFDRPFLICVKKRDADAVPFFLMWVDNAELMKRY